MKKIFLGFISFFVLSACFSQMKVVADKIVGIVGDKIILKSEIINENADMIRRGLPAEDDCSILDIMLTQKALVLQAEKDSIPVSEDDVQAEIDQKIRYFISQYGSKDALEQIAGQSVYQLKEYFRQPIREERLAQGMRTRIIEGIKITPTEVKEYYEKIPKDSLLFYEMEFQIGQIVAFPKASRDIEQLAVEDLTTYKKQAEADPKKFATLASLYSDDPGTKDKGGQMEISRGDKQVDPTFLTAAFRLKDGQISPLIKSKFGYHIIQMVSRSGDDAVIRHILKIPQITEPEINEAVTKLDSVREKLITGSIGFGEAVVKYSDDEYAKFTGGRLSSRTGSPFLTIDALDKDMVLLLKNTNLKPGEFSKPALFTDDRGKKGVRIVALFSKTEPHRENLKDDYSRIAQRALQEKQGIALQKWFASKISNYYIMIDNEYKTCVNLDKWKSKMATASK